jgi:hypothetical protein
VIGIIKNNNVLYKSLSSKPNNKTAATFIKRRLNTIKPTVKILSEEISLFILFLGLCKYFITFTIGNIAETMITVIVTVLVKSMVCAGVTKCLNFA